MRYAIPRKKHRRKVAFVKSTTPERFAQKVIQPEETSTQSARDTDDAGGELDWINAQCSKKMSSTMYPSWLTLNSPEEDYNTESSYLQQETAEECLPFLISKAPGLNASGLPTLSREKHVKFLRQSLGRLPAGFSSLDASRPWILYWCLNGLALLGEDITVYRESIVSTLTAIQNMTGGFGGGHGQYSHLATTYAAVLSLVAVGGDSALHVIDRKAMWHWLGSLKQPEGDFSVCVDGERDVRGAYCAMVLVALLNLPRHLPATSPGRVHGNETFLTGLPEWISRCQTYEGGISSSPGTEAHGAYAFCALAALCILGDPQAIMSKYLDLPALTAWLSARQHAPEGGLAGRTNKLVDGCYSHWIAGCWSLVEAATHGISCTPDTYRPSALWNRDALIRYILCCCQADKGGLRDKPSKHPDAYHTNYNLAGLSSAQNHFRFDHTLASDVGPVEAAFHWTCTKTPRSDGSSSQKQIFNEADHVTVIHPVFVVPATAVETARQYFSCRPLDISD